MFSYFRFSRNLTRYSFAGLAVLILGFAGWWYFGSYSAVPQVIGANFSVEYHKVPYNVPSLDVTFSLPLDAATITSKTVTLSPYVEGKATLEKGNIVRYTLASPLKVGEHYTLTLLKDITSSHGVSI